MKSLFALIALGAALIACSQDAPPPAVADDLEIAHLRVGLVCPQAQPEGGSICFETTSVQITGQGTCVYDGQQRPCTWYGFEFEYSGGRLGDEISCVVTSSHSADFGDPTGVRQEGVDRYEYRLRLEDRAGRYFNPQYTIFESNARPPAATVIEETVCSFGARELFRYQMELQFPG